MTVPGTIRRYHIFPIQPPLSSAQLAAYKTLRLTSLQVDPGSFSSNYAREVAFTEDVWRQRLDSPFKQILIASVSPVLAPGTSAHGQPGDGGDDVYQLTDASPPTSATASAGETGEWIGTATVVAPSGALPFALAPFKAAGCGSRWQIYSLWAMWVHPAHRGKGVGMRLVEAGLEWARTHADPALAATADSEGDGGASEKVVALLVHDHNVAGRALYSRAGFAELKDVSADEGEMWMLAKV